jgi:DNA primase
LALDRLHPYPAERGLAPATVETFGLGFANRGYFSGFICIPLSNAAGELVGYAGRWPDDAAVEAGTAEKYRLPPKFKKLELLFNIERVAGHKHVVLVEGFWSVFRFHERGIPAAALMGTTLSEAHISLLRDAGVRFATVMLDGDEPGQQGAREAVALLAAEGFWVRQVVLPAGEQPDTVPQEFFDRNLQLPAVSQNARR